MKLEAERQVDGPAAVSFDAYLSRGLVTRSGYSGELGIADLQSEGFGVFGYHTVNAPYNAAGLPDFMYNTKVDNPSGSAWTYSPVKYWPNQDTEDAVDRVSFFAYAPYVDVDPDSGAPSGGDDASAGITWLSRFTDAGDPLVGYRTSFTPSSCVDLCWGSPRVDVRRPTVAQKVDFTFRHALSALNVQVDAAVDELAPGANALDGDTRIYVRSLTFEGFATKGALNLNSPGAVPVWEDYFANGTPERTPVIVHDGRLDGLEARYDDPGEMPAALHPDIVQQGTYNAKPGVTNTAVNLFGGAQPWAPVYVIPNGYPLKVTVVYDVETRDDKLRTSYLSDGTTHGSVTRVSIVKPIATAQSGPIRLEAGKKYFLRLHLGMTSVKFAAEIAVSDQWSEDVHPIEFQVVTMAQDVDNTEANNGFWS